MGTEHEHLIGLTVMATPAVEREALFASLRRQIAKIEGTLADRLEVPDPEA